MTAPGFALFDTPIGRCGIAWGERGILGVLLPEARDALMRARLLQRFPTAREAPPPSRVQAAIEQIRGLLQGEAHDLSRIELDMSNVPAFHRRVYEAARGIRPGQTLSYGEVAQRVGAVGAARAVGQALGRNPFALVVPCHRVLAAGGKVGGFSAPGGATTKLKILAIEGSEREQELPLAGEAVLAFDPSVALAHVSAKDKPLARIIERVGPFGMKLKKTPSLFAALAESIVYQQLSGKAAASIYGRVCALFPDVTRGPTPERVLRASEESLRGAGLSRSKLLSLRDLTERALAGELPSLAEIQSLSDEDIVERLTPVRGVGRWTVEMLLMFRLGRADVLPLDDYGIKKGFAVTFKKSELPSRAELMQRGERWKPFRTFASWYLWRASELAGVKQPSKDAADTLRA